MAIATARPRPMPRPAAVERMPLAHALDLGPEAWDGLLTRSGLSNPFLTWAWYHACADAVPREAIDSCQAVVLRAATGELEAVFPFRVQEERRSSIPATAVGWAFDDLGCPDHLDLLASPEADLDALAGALEGIPWVVVKLANVAEAAGNVERFRAACERRGWMARRKLLGHCPYLDLPGDWDAYLSSLSPHGRHAIRHKERKLRKEHRFELTDYGHGRLEEGWRHLRRLHALRWGDGGAFRDPVWERLHRGFAAALADAGQLWLFTLDLDGTPAAVWYGFSLGDTVYHYQCGRDVRWERARVGTVLMGLMIHRAIERGYRRIDFLRGEEPYKAEWTRTARPCFELAVFRDGLHGATLRGFDSIALGVRRATLRLFADRLRHWLTQSGGLAK
ncbi:MAG TPA: GNAT family N-acetyltransferase [Gemmatimonadales bacterium]|nr:GNAT family N-acetyltransferase [Gemmatimonadales bacterium]